MRANKAYSCRRTALHIVVFLCALGATVGLAAAQQPTTAQKNALRSACMNDFMAHCSKVNPNGPGALACLQRNSASLSPRCRSAMSAVGGGSAPAGAQTAARPAPALTEAGAQQPTKAQQNALRSACTNDFMAHCSKVNPNGPGALPCLQKNAASLSAKCRTAVSAVGGGPAPAGAQAAVPPAPAPASAPTPATAPAPTQEADVAVVEAVSGRVVVFARGKPALLENSDRISDHAQLDLQADSELRFCHFKANRLLTLRGPTRAFVSADGVTDERGRTIDAAVGTCTPPAR
jgi:Rieske Fe-S protein